MSLTSYRAAPPRDTGVAARGERAAPPCGEVFCEWVRCFIRISAASCARAAMPGDDLLFHRLSDSTIGAVGFHGRVRDGIGWDTDAMVTRQWSLCAWAAEGMVLQIDACTGWFYSSHPCSSAALMLGVWTLQARIERLVSVSFTRHRASTSDLSRSWSSTALRNLISREASRLDAFSGYPVRT